MTRGSIAISWHLRPLVPASYLSGRQSRWVRGVFAARSRRISSSLGFVSYRRWRFSFLPILIWRHRFHRWIYIADKDNILYLQLAAQSHYRHTGTWPTPSIRATRATSRGSSTCPRARGSNSGTRCLRDHASVARLVPDRPRARVLLLLLLLHQGKMCGGGVSVRDVRRGHVRRRASLSSSVASSSGIVRSGR